MPDAEAQGSLFADRSGTATALAVYTVLAVALMVGDHHGRYLDRIRSLLSLVAHPVVELVHWPIDATRAAAVFVAERQLLLERTEALERRWLEARAELSRMAALERENERLRALLGSAGRVGDQVLVAELKAVDLDPFTHRILIDRGTAAQVYQGQPVADASGILGQVERVQPLTAFVRLLTDPSHAIPVAVNRTGLRAIAYGTGKTDQLVVRDVPRSADVRRGDLLVTSGLGGRFPLGFPVGVVQAVTLDAGEAFVTLEARPTAAVDRARQVLLLWPHEAVGPAASGAGRANGREPAP